MEFVYHIDNINRGNIMILLIKITFLLFQIFSSIEGPSTRKIGLGTFTATNRDSDFENVDVY